MVASFSAYMVVLASMEEDNYKILACQLSDTQWMYYIIYEADAGPLVCVATRIPSVQWRIFISLVWSV